MRKTTIAIRIPKVEFQPSSAPLNVFIKGTSEIFKSATPKERVQLSREYKRCITPISPVVYVPSSPPIQTPQSLKRRHRPESKPLNITSPSFSSNAVNRYSYQNSPFRSSGKQRLIRVKQETITDNLFDMFMKEKEMNRYLELEDTLFPKDYIENIQYIPDNHYFRFGSYNRDRINQTNTPKNSRNTSQKCVSGLKHLVKSRNVLPRLEESFIKENKIHDLFPKLMKINENK